jgi:hypothetical protein
LRDTLEHRDDRRAECGGCDGRQEDRDHGRQKEAVDLQVAPERHGERDVPSEVRALRKEAAERYADTRP